MMGVFDPIVFTPGERRLLSPPLPVGWYLGQYIDRCINYYDEYAPNAITSSSLESSCTEELIPGGFVFAIYYSNSFI